MSVLWRFISAIVAAVIVVSTWTPTAHASAGSVRLDVAEWDRDSSGLVTYDVTVTARGLDATGGPCATHCRYRVEGVYLEGGEYKSAGSLKTSYDGYYGSLDLHLTQSNQRLGDATHVRAVVTGAHGETLESAYIPVAATAEQLTAATAGGLAFCLALGEAAPSHTAGSSVPDVTLACNASGPQTAITLLTGAIGVAAAMDVLGEALDGFIDDYDPADCISEPGECIDQGSPNPEPEPEPQPAGAGGIKPPANCMDSQTRQHLLDDSAVNVHHLATDKSLTWTPEFESIAKQYDLNLDDHWNKVTMLHKGPHPKEYHQWVLRNMRAAHEIAQQETTPDARVERFVSLYREWVAEQVLEDETIVRRDYWKCYR